MPCPLAVLLLFLQVYESFCFFLLNRLCLVALKTFLYNSLNQLLLKGETSYNYDKCGNLIQKSEKGTTTTYSYDALDRLIALTENGKMTTYSYDSYNRRVSQTLPIEGESAFLFIGQEEAGRVKEGAIIELKVLGKGKRHPAVAIEIENEIYVPLFDLFGNVVCLFSLDGQLLQSFTYTAFGEMTSSASALSPWLFSGKRCDPSGLYHFGLRFYDPALGRWLSQDPAGFEDGQNLYTYVHNNPLIYFDEHGLFSLWDGVTALFSGIVSCFYYTIGALFDFSGPQIISTNDLIDPSTGKNYQFETAANTIHIYNNGIMNSIEEFKKTLLHLSVESGKNVIGLFTPTRSLTADVAIYFAELLGYRSKGSLALQKLIEEQSADKSVILISHSRGCVSARNAITASSENARQKLYYLAISPGAYLQKGYCQDVWHLCSSADFIPYLDVVGRLRCKATTIEIQRHPEAFFFDHSITSPTFTKDRSMILNEYADRILQREAA